MAQEMTATDKKYQAENDARTIVQAMEITNDKERYRACLKQLGKMKQANSDAISMMKEKHG